MAISKLAEIITYISSKIPTIEFYSIEKFILNYGYPLIKLSIKFGKYYATVANNTGSSNSDQFYCVKLINFSSNINKVEAIR